jgi:hypothetical protein
MQKKSLQKIVRKLISQNGACWQCQLPIDVPALTANIFAAATNTTSKTKQGRLAGP